ncbi:MAG: TIGR03619 family F420-dependent LLM class oxidoreductase [Anaerolineae bacterium]
MELAIRIPASGPFANAETLTRLTRWADELGYHSVWVSDHVVLPHHVASPYPYAADGRWTTPADTPWLDPLLALAWAATAAPRIRLAMSVLVLPLRNPVLLAKQLATLDVLSDGRVWLGVGAGWMAEEFELIGVPFADRGKRSVEMIRLMRALWSGETVNFQGDIWQLQDCQMYPRPVHGTIPVVWGGHSDAALRRVARLGDGWHPTLITMDELTDGVQRLHRFCEQAGRDFANLAIVARPGAKYRLTEETMAQHRALGVTHTIVDVPLTGEGLRDAYDEMARLARMV